MRLNSLGDWGSSYKSATARTRAAKPAAELARPAAVGKLFSETIRRGKAESFGKDGLADSRVCRSARRSERQASVRFDAWMFWGFEFRVSVSPAEAGNEAEQDAVVYARREL